MAVTQTVDNLKGWLPVSLDIATASTDYHFDFDSRETGIWPSAFAPSNARMLVRFDFVDSEFDSSYNVAGSWLVHYRFTSSSLVYLETLGGTGTFGGGVYTFTFSASGDDMRLTINRGAEANPGQIITVVPTIVLAAVIS